MIDALIAGRIFGAPQSRTSKSGQPFATGRLRVSMANGESLFASIVAFSSTALAALLALQDGDSVAISGELKIGIYSDKQGQAKPSLDLVAHAVLTTYHVGRKRRAVAASPSTPAGEFHEDEEWLSAGGRAP